MAPWNKAPPVAFTDSPTRRPLRSQASREELTSTQQYQQSIRSVTPQDDRPPSFHSQGHEQHEQQDAYREVEDQLRLNPYGGYASPPPTGDRYTPQQASYGQMYIPQEQAAPYREADTYDYQARTPVDLDLHLNDDYLRQGTPASYYSHDNPSAYHNDGTAYQQEDYDDDEDNYDEKQDKFEDSFEGPVEQWDDDKREFDEEKAEGEPLSPALSFAGGFGAPPATAHHRRNIRDARRVKLTDGNLVLDRPLPTRLAKFLPRKSGSEFLTTRYTACTAPPEGFNAAGYALRPTLLNRQVEMMIVVTIYNEDEVLFNRTMHGIQKNIAFLCSRKNSATWGPDGWKKIVVCIVADGRKAIHPRVLDVLGVLGLYQEGVATNQVGDKDVQAHIFEHTTQNSMSADRKIVGLENGIPPCQMMLCLKEKNAKKLNSHRWALQAFAPQLDPNVCVLIDAGTKPGAKSLYRLWKAFDRDSNVGGACGEICAMKGPYWSALFNPLVAAQNFEYKISNILDKPTESFFGYITVLPGAFSAYRWRALKNDDLGHGPLHSYFKGEHLAGADADVFTSNMYLAEDRILCWELVAKRGEAWVLKYVAGAQGETDVPDGFAEFIGQRRRWLNGSFFASAYAIRKTLQLRGSDHSTGKKIALYIQAIYNVINLGFAWFALANYWIFFMVLTTSLEDSSFGISGIKIVNKIVQAVYMGNVIACFLFSMGNKPKSAQWKYMTSIVLFALCACYMYVAAVFCLYKALVGGNTTIIMVEIVVSLASTYGAYVVASVIALDPAHLVTSFLQYMLLSPVYINLLNIYAFSNLHDFSWGTKNQTSNEVDLGVSKKVGRDAVEIQLPSAQDDVDSMYDRAIHNLKTSPMIVPPPQSAAQLTEAKQEYYASVRTNVLLAWVLSNGLLVVVILQGDYSTTFSSGGTDTRVSVFVVIILIFTAIMALIRLVGSTAFQVEHAVRVTGGHFKAWKGRKEAARMGRAQRKVGVATPKLPAAAAVGGEGEEDEDEWSAR